MNGESFENVIIVNSNSINSITQPVNIKIQLKQHQLKLYNYCRLMEKDDIILDKNFISEQNIPFYDNELLDLKFNTNIGCIVNTTNSGKSFVILALINNPITKSKLINLENNEFSSIQTNNFINKNNNIIVVAPAVYFQWEFYIKNYTTYDFGFINKKIDLENIISSKKHLLISTNYYKDFQKYSDSKKYLFDRVIYDDCDVLNISNCKPIRSKFYWFLSANVFNLLNPSNTISGTNSRRTRSNDQEPGFGIKCNGFIKNTFIKINNLKYQKLFFIKNENSEIDQSFNFTKPDVFKIEYNKNRDNIFSNANCLPNKLSYYILSNNVNDAITNFFNKTFDSVDSLLSEILLDAKNNKESINDIKNRIEYNIDPISLCEIEIKAILQCCFQSYDFLNLLTYYTFQLSPKCPICRANVDMDEILVIYDKKKYINLPEIFDSKTKSKKEILIYLINNIIHKTSNILIYANTPKIYKILDDLSIKYCEIRGTVSMIKKSLDKSKCGEVLILNQKTINNGLILPHITDLVIFSDIDKKYYERLTRKCYNPLKSLNIFEFI